MIIDFSSRTEHKTENQKRLQKEIVDRLENLLRLAKEGFIISFASTGFTSEGRMFMSIEQGAANAHEVHSAINIMSGMLSNVVIKTEQQIANDLDTKINVFSLPKLTNE